MKRKSLALENAASSKKQKLPDWLHYFFKYDEETSSYICQYEGCTSKRKTNQCSSNLKSHLQLKHVGWEDDLKNDKKKDGGLSKYLDPKGFLLLIYQ
jgi:hypothetical protein